MGTGKHHVVSRGNAIYLGPLTRETDMERAKRVEYW